MNTPWRHGRLLLLKSFGFFIATLTSDVFLSSGDEKFEVKPIIHSNWLVNQIRNNLVLQRIESLINCKILYSLKKRRKKMKNLKVRSVTNLTWISIWHFRYVYGMSNFDLWAVYSQRTLQIIQSAVCLVICGEQHHTNTVT